MNYTVLVSEYPIDIEKAEKLRILGLRVPFIPSDEDFNIYAYIPDTIDVPMSRIRAIHYFESLNSTISKSELDLYDSSVEKFNSLKIGDKVKIKGYKNLVTEIISIDGDKVISVINLRGYIYKFIEKLDRLSKSDIIYKNIEKTFSMTHSDKLYVDLSTYDKIEDEYVYTQSLFYFLLRLKLAYSKKEIILLNPKFGFNNLFGFSAVYGSPASINLRASDYICTENLTFYKEGVNLITYNTVKTVKHLVTVTPELFFQITKLKNSYQLSVYKEVIKLHRTSNKLLSKPKLIQDILYNVETVRNKFDITLPEISKSIELEVAQPLDIEETFNTLLSNKHINIAENLDYYLTILKG